MHYVICYHPAEGYPNMRVQQYLNKCEDFIKEIANSEYDGRVTSPRTVSSELWRRLMRKPEDFIRLLLEDVSYLIVVPAAAADTDELSFVGFEAARLALQRGIPVKVFRGMGEGKLENVVDLEIYPRPTGRCDSWDCGYGTVVIGKEGEHRKLSLHKIAPLHREPTDAAIQILKCAPIKELASMKTRVHKWDHLPVATRRDVVKDIETMIKYKESLI